MIKKLIYRLIEKKVLEIKDKILSNELFWFGLLFETLKYFNDKYSLKIPTETLYKLSRVILKKIKTISSDEKEVFDKEFERRILEYLKGWKI